MPRYCEACRTFITSRDSLKRTATLSLFTLNCKRWRTLTSINSIPRVLPLGKLCHSRSTTVKDFSTVVVLKMGVIVGSSPVIVGSRPKILSITISLLPFLVVFSLSTPVPGDGYPLSAPFTLFPLSQQAFSVSLGNSFVFTISQERSCGFSVYTVRS
jgi:hypothetical protein